MSQKIYLEYNGRVVTFDSFSEAQAEYRRLQQEGIEATVSYEPAQEN